MDIIGYDALRNEQAEKRKRGELMGIGICSFTEIVGAGPSKDFDILGIKMFDSAEIRVHPTGKAIARFGTKSQGQGHETTYAQIVAEELGIPASRRAGRGGRHRHRALRPGHLRQPLDADLGRRRGAWRRARSATRRSKLAAHLLEVREDDLEWEPGKFSVKGAPQKSKTIQECAFAAYTNHPQGMEAGLEATHYYDPPNLTFPFGSYICVVDIDRGTGEVKVRRFVAVDDCGNIINPMIVEGQIHGGLDAGPGPGAVRGDQLRRGGQHLRRQLHGLLRAHLDGVAAVGRPDKTITPSPHHPFGAKGVGESATVGAPPAIANAVVDALRHLGVTHIDIPITPEKVWQVLKAKGVAE